MQKFFRLGILAITLVFGMALAGCDLGDTGDTHTHSYDSWHSNASQHWKECSCGEEDGRSAHSGNPCSVCGYNSGGSSGITKPGTVTGVTATVLSSSSIRVSWNAVSGATSYNVYYGSAGNSNPVLSYSVTGTSRDFTSLISGSTYYYKVSAVNSAGEGPASSLVYAIPSSGITTVPGAPTGLIASVLGTDGYMVSWNSVSGATKYEVQWSTNGSTWYLEDETTQTYLVSSGWKDIGGVFAYFRVRAYNSIGWGSYSSAYSSWRSL